MKQGQRPDAQERASQRLAVALMPSRRTKRVPAHRGRGIQLSASTRHAKRASAASILPACLRRIQAVERNVAKQRANGDVHWPLRRGVKCSRLQTDGVRQSIGGSLRMSVRSHAPEQTRSAVCRRIVRCAACASEALAASSICQRSEVGGASRTGRNAVLAQRCLGLSRD
jgi:hypothetical protein